MTTQLADVATVGARIIEEVERAIVGKRVERIGVEHERCLGPLEHLPYKRGNALTASQSRPQGQDVGWELEDGVGG